MTGVCVVCVKPVGAANVKVYGPAVDAPVKANAITYLVVDCKEAGPGLLHITSHTQYRRANDNCRHTCLHSTQWLGSVITLSTQSTQLIYAGPDYYLDG